MYACVCVYTCMYVCMYVCMCVCVYMYVCMYVCMHVCVCIHVCMCACMKRTQLLLPDPLPKHHTPCMPHHTMLDSIGVTWVIWVICACACVLTHMCVSVIPCTRASASLDLRVTLRLCMHQDLDAGWRQGRWFPIIVYSIHLCRFQSSSIADHVQIGNPTHQGLLDRTSSVLRCRPTAHS